jgi:hypothetical protein
LTKKERVKTMNLIAELAEEAMVEAATEED